jgi:hypothetical protein
MRLLAIGGAMTVQMQTVSARLPSEDLQWLSALELPGAVTPSDKLRALIAQMRKQHEGALDYSACLAWLRDLLSSFVIELRGIEHHERTHSEAVSTIIAWAPQVMATMLSARDFGDDGVARAREVEDALVQCCFRLLMALLRLGVTPAAECYAPDAIEKHLPRVIELMQLIAANRESLKEKQL